MIKVVALDIYGTVLCSDDYDNVMPPRAGTRELFDLCQQHSIAVVSASDSDVAMTCLELQEAGISPELFARHYQLNQLPFKDFSKILEDYGIEGSELLVIGDRDKDILGAQAVHARFIRVPEYVGSKDSVNVCEIVREFLKTP